MKALTKLMRYMRPYRLEIFVGVWTVVLPVLMELLIPYLLWVSFARTTLAPFKASPWARLTAVVVLPTPPLAMATAIFRICSPLLFMNSSMLL